MEKNHVGNPKWDIVAMVWSLGFDSPVAQVSGLFRKTFKIILVCGCACALSTVSKFCVSSGDLSSGPHVCKALTLLMEQSPQPQEFV